MLRRFLSRLAGVAFLLCCTTLVVAQDAPAKPFLHPLFTDHMVLQRDTAAPVWGWTKPGETVTVKIADQTATATADANGKWMAKLKPLAVSASPLKLEVTGSQTATVNDVLVGDVWICSGQSNMEWVVQNSNNPQEEIKNANYPLIRLFTVPKKISATPVELVDSKWVECVPANTGHFSAVGYFFGRHLNNELKIPIGLIHTSWGGTVAEAWTSAEALETMPDFKASVEAFRALAAESTPPAEGYDKAMAKWWASNDEGSKENAWAKPTLDAAAWPKMKLPQHWEGAGLANFDGIVWFRKEIDVPAELAGKDAVLQLGAIDDRDTTWFNGQQIGSKAEYNQDRNYKVSGKLVQAGKNVIAVRVLDTGAGGGFSGPANKLQFVSTAAPTKPISLADEWQYQASTPLAKASAAPPTTFANNPNVTTVLYNGMVAPLVPFAIKGAIWYQGESNAGRAEQYKVLLPTMIKDWRTRFGVGEFPFMVVQLANFLAVQKNPVENGWAELREAQQLTATNDPKVGIAIITDIGDEKDIHPRNKQDVGKRLALQALAIAYGKDLVSAGPQYKSLEIQDGKVRLKFANVGGGLVAKDGGALKGFAIAGKDKQWKWADATIDGDTIVVSSADVPQPEAVRYNWANNPIGNLFNKEQLPAAPFKTDGK